MFTLNMFTLNTDDKFILYNFEIVLIKLDLHCFPIIDGRAFEWLFQQIKL